MATDYISGDVIYISIWNNPKARMKLTLTSGGTLVGTGNGQYIYGTGTLDEINDVSNVVEFDDYFLIAKEEPAQFPIRIPASDILGLISYIASKVGEAGDPIDGNTMIMLANLTGIPIIHLERHFADRYSFFGNYSIVGSGVYDAKGEIDASQLTNATKIIRIGVRDDVLADFNSDIVAGSLVELYVDDNNYLLGKVNNVSSDSLKSSINGKYVYLSSFSLVGSVGSGNTAGFRLYKQGDGNVPVPESADIGRVLIATGVNAYDWGTPYDLFVGASDVGGTASATTLSPSPAIESYVAGQKISYVSKTNPTGAFTVNVNSLGAKNVVREDNTTIETGDVLTGRVVELQYDGTSFRLLNRHIVVSTPTTTSMLTLTSSWQNVGTGYADGDFLSINTEGAYSSESNNIAMVGITVQFSQLSTSSRWLGIRANSAGARVEIRKSGTNVQARTQGSVANCKAWVIKLN